MKTLFQAIYARYQATALSDSLTDLYFAQAPPKTVFPYGVFSLISDVADWTFTEDFEDCLIQFSLFSSVMSDQTEICTAFELLKAAFDKFDLVVADYRIVSLERGIANLIKQEDVWHYAVTYRIYLEKIGD